MSGDPFSARKARRVAGIFEVALWSIATLAVLGAVLFFATNIRLTNREAIESLLRDGWFRRSVWLSTITATVATAIAIVLGMPAAYALSRLEFRGKAATEVLLSSVIVLPASTLGLFLMVAFQYPPVLALQERLGCRLVHSLPAIIIAQLPLALALGIRAWQAAFDAVDPRYEQVARSLGVSPGRALRTVTLPLAASGLMAGVLLAWTRAVAEFGAALLFAGTFRMHAPNQFSSLTHLLGLNNADLLSVGMWMEIEGGRTERGVAIGFLLLILSGLSVWALTRLGRDAPERQTR